MFIYREVAALFRLRPTLRAQLTLLYGGFLAALGGGLLVVLVPLRGTASVQEGPHAAAIAAALNAAEHDKEIIGAIALPVVVLLAVVGGWLIAGRLLRPLRTITATASSTMTASAMAPMISTLRIWAFSAACWAAASGPTPTDAVPRSGTSPTISAPPSRPR